MQKKLTFRDWVLYFLISLLILLLVLTMYQIDRQWLKLTDMETAMSEQSKDMRELRGIIASGVLLKSSANSSATKDSVAPVFNRAQAATHLPDYAQGDWVFSIDADEMVSPELKAEIQAAMLESSFNGYEIPRLSSYCGKQIRHSGWYPDYVLRLFKRETGCFTDHVVHERIIVQGVVGQLSVPLLHDAFINLEEVLHKVNSYSSLGANMLYQKNVSSSLSKAIFKALWTFIRTYGLKGGFLDGQQGLMLAISNAEGSYYKYLKLWELQSRQQ